jgi:predicted glycogen debranching enzyme
MGTVSGLPTRRYHGLLVAALKAPLGRTVLASGLHERVDVGSGATELGATRWVSGHLGPRGFDHLEAFRLEGTSPVWTYAIGEALLEKRVFMEQGEHSTYVLYRVLRASGPLKLSLDVLATHRDYHGTARSGDWLTASAGSGSGAQVQAAFSDRVLHLRTDHGSFELRPQWYHDLVFAEEAARGLDAVEDQLLVGTFQAELHAGDTLTLVASLEPTASTDGAAAWARREARESELLTRFHHAHPAQAADPGWVRQLALAADQFLVRRQVQGDPEGMTVMAGYPWFGDWGRDTMIALPGLALCTGRTEVAGRILATFARFVDQGMLPNLFPDAGEVPEYNTADATLWYVQAIRAYVETTGDRALLASLFPVLEDIFAWHRRGTRYGIGVDPADGLLRSGEPGVQLTWMDAKVGDWVVTPRMGKTVELNALWYSGLWAMAGFATMLGKDASGYTLESKRLEAAFQRFWNPERDCCFDVIDGPQGDDASLRPNQIFAVSLPESPLRPEQQQAVVDVCGRSLLTSVGLRSLAPGEPGYQGRYEGNNVQRDGCYHQGTVWSWLLGPYALAHFRVHGDAKLALSFLEPLSAHLGDACVGSISEIFDGDAPFMPRGAVAQAWGVSELLRAWLSLSRAASLDPHGSTGHFPLNLLQEAGTAPGKQVR